jgi:hypothetical protein
MSFVQINTLGPLTTIFKPPVGCFEQFPQTWSTCNTGYISPYYGLNCYLSQPESCYPTSALINEWHGKDFTYAADYWYSPGVLPSGFTPVAALTTSDATTIYGCLSYASFQIYIVQRGTDFGGGGTSGIPYGAACLQAGHSFMEKRRLVVSQPSYRWL